MAVEVRMPKLGMTMTKGRLMSWEKKEGEAVKKGETLFQVSTDKVTAEVEAQEEGTLLEVLCQEGETVPVGGVVAWIGAVGERLDGCGAKTSEAETPETPDRFAAPEGSSAAQFGEKTGRLRATPAARALAREKGIELAAVTGSGTDGRIYRRDVESRLESDPQDRRAWEELELLPIQEISARRMTENFSTAPHFYLQIRAEVTTAFAMLERARRAAAAAESSVPGCEGRLRPTFSDILLWTLSRLLPAFPRVNARYADGRIRAYKEANIGLAVDTPQGLVVPVIMGADRMDFMEIVRRRTLLVEKAREGRLLPDEMSGGSFTVSNLGMYGVESFQAILNSPESALLAVGGIVKEPALREGKLAEIPLVKFSLSCDHRVLDGASGAKFLRRLQETLESPARLLDDVLF